MRVLMSLLFVSLWGVALGSVWITQWSTRDQYEAGDSAVLQCNISTHGETLIGCKMSWVIINQSNRKRTKDILTVEKYQHKVHKYPNGTITLDNLSVNDTEPLICKASCIIDGALRQISGNGTSLIITERRPESGLPWLTYLFFSINLLVFLIATFICVLIIRKRRRNNRTRSQ